MYHCLPMYHSTGGVLATGAVLTVGGSCFIRERFSASDFWTDVVRHECTMFVYVGELCRYLLNAPPGPQGPSPSHPALLRQRPAARHFRDVPRSFRHPADPRILRARRKAMSRCSISTRTPARSGAFRSGRRRAFRSRSSPMTSSRMSTSAMPKGAASNARPTKSAKRSAKY